MTGLDGAQFIELVARAVDWTLNHPVQLFLLLALMTFIGEALKRGIDEIAALLTAPGRAAVDVLEPAIGPSKPWSLESLTGAISSFFEPVRERPTGSLQRALAVLAASFNSGTRSATSIFSSAAGVGKPSGVLVLARRTETFFAPVRDLPVGGLRSLMSAVVASIRSVGGWLRASGGPSMPSVASHLASATARAEGAATFMMAQVGSTLAALNEGSNRWVGWRIIGAWVFALGLAGFLYADAGIAFSTFALMLGVTELPAWIDLPQQFTFSSVVSFVVLGVVVTDFLGMTHLGPWTNLVGLKRWIVLTFTLLVLVVLLAINFLVSEWRAAVVVKGFLSAEQMREVEGRAITGLLPTMLLVSAMAFSGVVAGHAVLWALACLLTAQALRAFGLAVRLAGAFVNPVRFAVRWTAALFAIAGLGAAVSVLALVLAVHFSIVVVAMGVILAVGVAGLMLWHVLSLGTKLAGIVAFTAAVTAGIVLIALAFVAYFSFTIATMGAVLAVAILGLVAWGLLWWALHLIVLVVGLQIEVTDRFASVLKAIVDLLACPGARVWNFAARSKWMIHRFGDLSMRDPCGSVAPQQQRTVSGARTAPSPST